MLNSFHPCRVHALPVILAGVFLTSTACIDLPFLAPAAAPTSAATPTPAATSTPTVTLTPVSTQAPAATLAPTSDFTPTASYLDWSVFYLEQFDYDAGVWNTGKMSDANAMEDFAVTGGKYLLKITSLQSVFDWTNPAIGNLTDFYLTTDVEKITSPEECDYGLIFRNSGDNLYYFHINAPAKLYAVSMFAGNVGKPIIYWTSSEFINPIGLNQLSVLARGSQFMLAINGEEVNSFTEDTLKTGMVGIAFGLYRAGEYLKLEFDNFIVMAPKAG